MLPILIFWQYTRWYLSLALAPFKACHFLRPDITRSIALPLLFIFLSSSVYAAYLLASSAVFSRLSLYLSLYSLVALFASHQLWRDFLFGPEFSEWFRLVKLYPAHLSNQKPHWLPSPRFDSHLRAMLDSQPEEAIYILAHHPLPPKSSLTRFDLRPALLSQRRSTRELTIRAIAKLSKTN